MRQQLCTRPAKRPAVTDIVAHMLPGALATRTTGVGWFQANGFHLVGPLSVVIGGLARLAVMMLPKMDHFVRERREDFVHAPPGEVHGIHGNLVRDRLPVMATPASAGEIAVGAVLALHGHQAGRQLLVH